MSLYGTAVVVLIRLLVEIFEYVSLSYDDDVDSRIASILDVVVVVVILPSNVDATVVDFVILNNGFTSINPRQF